MTAPGLRIRLSPTGGDPHNRELSNDPPRNQDAPVPAVGARLITEEQAGEKRAGFSFDSSF